MRRYGQFALNLALQVGYWRRNDSRRRAKAVLDRDYGGIIIEVMSIADQLPARQVPGTIINSTAIDSPMPTLMQQAYIIYFRYKAPTDKSAPVRQYRVYAETLEEARKLAAQYANYPNIELLDVKPA